MRRAEHAGRGPWRRLVRARWTLLALVTALLVLHLRGSVSPGEAAAVIVAVLAATLMRPRQRSSLREAVVETRRPVLADESMQGLADALPDPCFVLDRRGILRFANRPARVLFEGLRAGDPLAYRLRTPEIIAAIERVSAGGVTERCRIIERVPTERWFEAHVAPIAAAGGRGGEQTFEFVAVILHDLTELKRLERMRADLVANASHELRTPLASLRGFVETLLGPARHDTAARDRFLPLMLAQAERMSRLIDDLLSLSRIEMKVHVRPTDRIDLGDVVRHVTDTLGPLARDSRVEIRLDLPRRAPAVLGDRDELIQVVENLVENAIKYGAQGGRIDVSGRIESAEGDRPASFTVEVRDYGPGIPPEHLPRLTERFYRVDVAASREKGGTGLGLAIVKHIVNHHRGRLDVESRPGAGAMFRVSIPLAPTDAGHDGGPASQVG